MNLFSFRPRLGFRGALALGGAAVAVSLFQRFLSSPRTGSRRNESLDTLPQTAGAKSAVTGGAPEDINGMPPVPMEKEREATVYDGSDLPKPKAS